MRKIEITSAVILIISILFKLLLYPGASVMLIVSLGTLSILYTYFGFLLLNGIKTKEMFKKQAYKHLSSLRIIGSILLSISIGALLIGILFKIQFYPGAFIMTNTGFLSTSMILAIFLIKSLTSSPSDIFKKNKFRLVSIVIFGLFFTTISTNDMIDFRFRSDPEYRDLFKQSLTEPDNQEIKEQLNIMRIRRERGYNKNEE